MNQCTKILALMAFCLGKPAVAMVADLTAEQSLKAQLDGVHASHMGKNPSSPFRYAPLDTNFLIHAYTDSYQSIEKLQTELKNLNQPYSLADIATLLYNRRVEILTEFLLLCDTQDFPTTTRLACGQLIITIAELQKYALNFALFLAHHPDLNEKNTGVIAKIFKSNLDNDNFEIAKLLLIAGFPAGEDSQIVVTKSLGRQITQKRILASSSPNDRQPVDSIVLRTARSLDDNNVHFFLSTDNLAALYAEGSDFRSRRAEFVLANRLSRPPQTPSSLSQDTTLKTYAPVAMLTIGAAVLAGIVYHYCLKLKARYALRTVQLLAQKGPLNEEPIPSSGQEITTGQRLRKLYELYELEKLNKEVRFIANYGSFETKKEFLNTYRLQRGFFKVLEEMDRIPTSTTDDLSTIRETIKSIFSSIEHIKKSVEKPAPVTASA